MVDKLDKEFIALILPGLIALCFLFGLSVTLVKDKTEYVAIPCEKPTYIEPIDISALNMELIGE